ncbi:MAG: guanine deaminase [Clostridiales bacterium]|nr:MAG: guanine deaminase [Clostridiales bacterium]
MSKKIIKSNFIDSADVAQLNLRANYYMLIKDGVIVDLVTEIPADWSAVSIVDYSAGFVIPPFVDAHVHAPQYNNRGLGLDMELLDWLDTYTFPEERKFGAADYAKRTYKQFINALWRNGSLASVVFASIHKGASLELANLMIAAGLKSFIGKVNMDQNSPDYYIEDGAESFAETRAFIDAIPHSARVKPIITPRFAPSCSAELLVKLGDLAKQSGLSVQSHLSENQKEIDWVKSLFPNCESYGDVYDSCGLMVPDYKTIMAHCVFLKESEKRLLSDKQIVVAHCPHSNANLASGIAPIAEFVARDIPVALGSDISGGNDMFIGRAMQLALMLSNMYWVHEDKSYGKLSFENVFYFATRSGGKLFGELGAFDVGYAADFLVIDDSGLRDLNERNLKERLQRFVYCGDDRQISERYIDGEIVKKPFDI